jgi:hypothetical protein
MSPVEYLYDETDDGGSLEIPTGYTQAVIEAWGGGGKGADGEQTGRGGGGGGGAYSKKTLAVSAGDVLDLSIPTENEKPTTITRSAVTVCEAYSGDSGDLTQGGDGGDSASGTGDTKYSGGDGYFYATGFTGGGGGSSAGTAANGNNATSSQGAVGPAGGYDGGDGGSRYNSGFDAPSFAGGGGGAGEDLANPTLGGVGGPGRVKITIT